MKDTAGVLTKMLELANEKGITQKELAIITGLGIPTIYNKRLNNPKLNTLKKIAQALNCTVAFLIGESEKR